MGHWWSRALPWAVALVLTSWQTSHALGSLLQEFTFSTQVDSLSCSDPSTCTLHSTNATSETFQESLNHFTVRFGLNVNADEVVFGPGQLENGIAEFTTNFTIAPGNYDLTITVHRSGALRRSADALFCGGSVSLADMGAPSFTVNGVADDRLSGFVFPGTSIADGEGDADAAVPADAQSQILQFRGRTVPDQLSLTFVMNAAAFSHSCEVSARLGAPNLSTQDCDSCGYPGDPARTIEDDGLFVEVNVDNKCGDGATQPGEQCDLANLNGDPSSCCDFDCTFKQHGRVCRPAAGPCDQAESCSGTDRACPPDFNAPPGTMCADDGNPCTTDTCNDAGQCIHTPFVPCAALCGNGAIDPGEDCDLGKLLNGGSSNCCDTSCKFRPDNSGCDDGLFCNGIEHCTNGVCGGSPGTRCDRACEVCDEASNLCDASHCPPPPLLPLQPTPELLIGEIFDGDGDRFDTSAGGSVRGTLDLDANGDLRFTAADLLRLPRCADDAVLVGAVCVDKYEASVFSNPPGGTSLGDQFGLTNSDYPCNPDGGNCRGGIFARSVQGVTPSRFVTWFQAQQACANVGKRLPTNAEWQMAVAGTPDTGANDDGGAPCNTSSGGSVVEAGSRPDCVSKWGIHDMVGNVWEWVAEWMPASSACPGWGDFSDDFMCLAGASETETNPGAQLRGGGVGTAAGAGPLAIINFSPSSSNPTFGFRCARAPF